MKKKISLSKNHVVCVVIASKGYPGSYKKNLPLSNLNLLEKKKDVKIFHAGTKNLNGKVVSSGGRVLSITATGKNISEARSKAYLVVERLKWKDGFFRKDIGFKNF